MIRRATIDDIPVMIALQISVEDEHAIWGHVAASPEDWAKRDLAWTHLAVVAGEAVGLIHCQPRPYSGECVFPSGSKILEIVDLFVAEPHRGQGLGHGLVAAIQAQAHEEGFTHLRLYSAAKRFDSILTFYRSCGFAPWYLEMTQEIASEPSAAGDACAPPRLSRTALPLMIAITQESFDSVLSECRGLVPEMPLTDRADRAFERLRDRTDTNFVGRSGSEALAFLVGYDEPDGYFYVYLFGVAPTARRTGIGSRLLTHVEQWAAQAGYAGMRLQSRNKYPDMLRLVIGHGYRIVGYEDRRDINASPIRFEKTLRE